jgi:hypothetical protein
MRRIWIAALFAVNLEISPGGAQDVSVEVFEFDPVGPVPPPECVRAACPTGPTVFFNVINSTRGPIDATVQCFAYHANGSLLEVRSTVVKDVRARSDQYASIEFSNALPWIRNVACRIDQVNPAR